MKRDSWWGRQLQREDLLTTLEQGRRVEVELFQEKHRGLRTMGELLKARMFGATEYAINLRRRMTNYVQGGGVAGASEGKPARGYRPPEPHQWPQGQGAIMHPGAAAQLREIHQWPCDDPFCQPCEEGVKRLLKDVGVLPRKRGKR
jgi:hypothetical protein